ncbi:MAG: hypothetical protein V4580_18090 [Bacteroidota bacterium]
MRIDTGKEQFHLFRYVGDEECYVAVPINYMPFIQAAEKEFGMLSNVPSDQTARGIFLKATGDDFDEHSPQNDILIKNLVKF